MSEDTLFIPVSKETGTVIMVVNGREFKLDFVDNYTVKVADSESAMKRLSNVKDLLNIIADIPLNVLAKWNFMDQESYMRLVTWTIKNNCKMPGQNHGFIQK